MKTTTDYVDRQPADGRAAGECSSPESNPRSSTSTTDPNGLVYVRHDAEERSSRPPSADQGLPRSTSFGDKGLRGRRVPNDSYLRQLFGGDYERRRDDVTNPATLTGIRRAVPVAGRRSGPGLRALDAGRRPDHRVAATPTCLLRRAASAAAVRAAYVPDTLTGRQTIRRSRCLASRPGSATACCGTNPSPLRRVPSVYVRQLPAVRAPSPTRLPWPGPRLPASPSPEAQLPSRKESMTQTCPAPHPRASPKPAFRRHRGQTVDGRSAGRPRAISGAGAARRTGAAADPVATFIALWQLLTAHSVVAWLRFNRMPPPMSVLGRACSRGSAPAATTTIWLASLQRILLGFGLAAVSASPWESWSAARARTDDVAGRSSS